MSGTIKMIVEGGVEVALTLDAEGRLRQADVWWGLSGPPWPNHAGGRVSQLLDLDQGREQREKIMAAEQGE